MKKTILAMALVATSALCSANFNFNNIRWQASGISESSQVLPVLMKEFGSQMYILEYYMPPNHMPQGLQYCTVTTANAPPAPTVTQSTPYSAPLYDSLYPSDITVTSSNVLVLARESGSSTGVSVIAYNLTGGSPTRSAFIAAPSGQGMWPLAIETAPSGNVYALWAYGTSTGTPTNLTGYGIGKFNAAGVLQWTQQWTGTGTFQLQMSNNMQSSQDMVILNGSPDQVCVVGTNNTGSGVVNELDTWSATGTVSKTSAPFSSPSFGYHITTDGTTLYICGQAPYNGAPAYSLAQGTPSSLSGIVMPIVYNPYPITSGAGMAIVHDSTNSMTYLLGQNNSLAGALDLYGISSINPVSYWSQLGCVPSPASNQSAWPMIVDPCTSSGGLRGVDVAGVVPNGDLCYLDGWYYTGTHSANFPVTQTPAFLWYSDASAVYALSGSSTNMTLTKYY